MTANIIPVPVAQYTKLAKCMLQIIGVPYTVDESKHPMWDTSRGLFPLEMNITIHLIIAWQEENVINGLDEKSLCLNWNSQTAHL